MRARTIGAYLSGHRKLATLVLTISVAGGAIAAVSIISNVLEYPGVVNNQMVLSGSGRDLGETGTHLTWFAGVRKNVTVTAHPNGFIGNAHVAYEVHALGVHCADVSLTPFPGYGSGATCSEAIDVVRFDTNSQYFNGELARIWWFYMTFLRGFSSATLQIYAVAD